MIKLDNSRSKFLFGICQNCDKNPATWFMEDKYEYWCSDCRDIYIGDVEEEDVKIFVGDEEVKGMNNGWNICTRCSDENNIMVPYELIVKADQILFLVGQHGNAVLDPDLREQMIKVGSGLRKIYMNMKGE